MLKKCSDLFEEWNKEVTYCHWKSNEHLEEGLDGLTDLDVYVCPNDKIVAEKILEKHGYIKCRPQRGAMYDDVDEWLGFDEETGKLIHVHLHYVVITGTKYNKEYLFPISELMEKTRILDSETQVYVTCPELEIIILYSRIVLKANNKRSIHLNTDFEREIQYLKKKIDINNLFQIGHEIKNVKWDEFFTLIVKDKLNEDEWYSLFRIVDNWLKPYKRRNVIETRVRYNFFKLKNILNSIQIKILDSTVITRKTFPDKKMSICFLGVDGCGKSTVTNELEKWLNWKVEAKRFYLGSGDHFNPLSKRLLNLVYRKYKSVSKINKVSSRDHYSEGKKTENKTGIVKRIAEFCFDFLQSIYLLKVVKHAKKEVVRANYYTDKGAIALFDRFPQIQFEGIYDGPKIEARYGKKYNSAILKLMANKEKQLIKSIQRYSPSVCIKLFITPEESLRRKPDENSEDVTIKAQITKSLIFDNSKVYEIDATQNFEKEMVQIKGIIWRELVQ